MEQSRAEAVQLTEDHKPHLEQQRGAARLVGHQLYWEEGGSYLSYEGAGNEPGHVQRLAVSRALGNFDLTGDM